MELISNQFVAKEREAINSKIEEFTQAEEEIANIDPLKQALVFLKINVKSLETNELQNWLKANVSSIKISQDATVAVAFKLGGILV